MGAHPLLSPLTSNNTLTKMKVFVATIALFAFVSSALAGCGEECKLQCDNALQLCLLNPLLADQCKVAKASCDKVCDAGCACLDPCQEKCEAPALGDDLLGNAMAQGKFVFCKLSCHSACGMTVATTATEESVNTFVASAAMATDQMVKLVAPLLEQFKPLLAPLNQLAAPVMAQLKPLMDQAMQMAAPLLQPIMPMLAPFQKALAPLLAMIPGMAAPAP